VKQRGRCPVCGFNARLRLDGRTYRHWDGFGASNPDGTCRGWGALPLPASVPDVNQAVKFRKALVDFGAARWLSR
jgi:hypothetical protein